MTRRRPHPRRQWALALALAVGIATLVLLAGQHRGAGPPLTPAAPSGLPPAAAAGGAPAQASLGSPAPAVRRFLAGYLAYSYGHPSPLPASTDQLRADLLAQPPRVAPNVAHRVPRVIALSIVARTADEQRALAQIDDGHSRYPVELAIVASSAGWQVAQVDPTAVSDG